MMNNFVSIHWLIYQLLGTDLSFTQYTEVTIVHFNDVYNIEPTAEEPVGGAARFCSLLKSYKPLEPLVLFSGDVFSPSSLSFFTRGAHMSVVLNECGVHAAVFGNHDFDFGFGVLKRRVDESNFPWLLSNVLDKQTNRTIANSHRTHIIHHRGKRFGLMGLIEQKWLDTQLMIDSHQLVYTDFVHACNQLTATLQKKGCDYIIVLSHMRADNDKILAEGCPGVDLVLAGHDHEYEVTKVGGKQIVKSGTDFKQLSQITLQFKEDLTTELSIHNVSVTSGFEEDARLKQLLMKYSDIMKQKGGKLLMTFSEPLDSRADVMWRAESSLGSWLCDTVLAATRADLVLLNGGTFKADRVFPYTQFTSEDLAVMLPIDRGIVVLNVTGKTILAALENGVSRYPRKNGRFLQVAGVRFAFDPQRPAGERVVTHSVTVGGTILDESSFYRLATRVYMYRGFDQFTMLKGAQQVADRGECMTLRMVIYNFNEMAHGVGL